MFALIEAHRLSILFGMDQILSRILLASLLLSVLLQQLLKPLTPIEPFRETAEEFARQMYCFFTRIKFEFQKLPRNCTNALNELKQKKTGSLLLYFRTYLCVRKALSRSSKLLLLTAA